MSIRSVIYCRRQFPLADCQKNWRLLHCVSELCPYINRCGAFDLEMFLTLNHMDLVWCPYEIQSLFVGHTGLFFYLLRFQLGGRTGVHSICSFPTLTMVEYIMPLHEIASVTCWWNRGVGTQIFDKWFLHLFWTFYMCHYQFVLCGWSSTLHFWLIRRCCTPYCLLNSEFWPWSHLWQYLKVRALHLRNTSILAWEQDNYYVIE